MYIDLYLYLYFYFTLKDWLFTVFQPVTENILPVSVIEWQTSQMR